MTSAKITIRISKVKIDDNYINIQDLTPDENYILKKIRTSRKKLESKLSEWGYNSSNMTLVQISKQKGKASIFTFDIHKKYAGKDNKEITDENVRKLKMLEDEEIDLNPHIKCKVSEEFMLIDSIQVYVIKAPKQSNYELTHGKDDEPFGETKNYENNYDKPVKSETPNNIVKSQNNIANGKLSFAEMCIDAFSFFVVGLVLFRQAQ